jgi:hypothetical protein
MLACEELANFVRCLGGDARREIRFCDFPLHTKRNFRSGCYDNYK